MSDGGPKDPRFIAAVDFIGRMGSKSFQIRYDDDPEPTVWIAVAEFDNRGTGHAYEAAAALTPLGAVMRLLDELVDGGTCSWCRRPTGVTDDWTRTMPLDDLVCWQVFDPEMSTFRRSCAGDDHKPVGRNDPCPCGSGQKFKRCHGSGRSSS